MFFDPSSEAAKKLLDLLARLIARQHLHDVHQARTGDSNGQADLPETVAKRIKKSASRPKKKC
jgi:hypothetical protein